MIKFSRRVLSLVLALTTSFQHLRIKLIGFGRAIASFRFVLLAAKEHIRKIEFSMTHPLPRCL